MSEERVAKAVIESMAENMYRKSLFVKATGITFEQFKSEIFPGIVKEIAKCTSNRS